MKSGARVILTDNDYVFPENLDLKGVYFVQSDNPRQDLSLICSKFYAPLPDHMIAVTGTNGKSSVVHFSAQLWQHENVNGIMMGTLNNALTTPDPVTLFETLGRLKQDNGVTHVAMEISSHGLSQYRVDGVPFKVAAFTNFTQDHLDYHIDMESYFTAKMRLFEDLLPVNGVAVLNADVSSYKSLSDVCKRRGIRTVSYGRNGQEIILRKRNIVGVQQEISLEVMGENYELIIPFVGMFQVMNMLCSLGCLIASTPNDKLRIKTLVEAMPILQGVPGRLQHISDPAGMYNAYVDYAHTPDALETVLNALRPHTDKRLICVFGCGGDRDVLKRSKMGEISARFADVSIITDDNPRSEDPALIREQINAGIPEEIKEEKDVRIVDGRRAAIEQAVNFMQEGDILLLAGKGHEKGQIVGDTILPFDDVMELSNALKNKS